MKVSFALFLTVSAAMLNAAQAPPETRRIVSPDEEYRIGPSDVVEVYILKVPELSREYRVSADGTIELPFLGKVPAQNKSSHELATLIATSLSNGYLVDPQVSVIVKQISRRFFIQGAVHNPGVYHIEGQPSLLELITISGGLTPTYGATAFILHSVRPAAEGEPEYELRKANINALLRGEFSQNAALEPGDIVHIPAADVFFVAGEVKAPGSFQLKEGTTLRQAISLAQGTSPVAAADRAVIFREEGNGQKREIPVDVGAVMRGKKDDIPILPNDIVVIPNSKAKSAFKPVINAFGVGAAWSATTILR
jgi:polysaccharide biosynthesis/export protein